MKKKLIIVGAGGFGREMLAWAADVVESGTDWYPAGFLDDNADALDSFDVDLPILGAADSYKPAADEVFVCAVGDPRIRLEIARSLQSRGAEFAKLIHPSAVIGDRVQLGIGFVACPQVCVTCDVTLGDFVALNVNVSIGHDAVLGDGCTLSGHCDVTGGVQLGKGVFMGTHSCIHPGIEVGDYARVGAGSVVMRAVPPNTTVLGVPAKKIISSPQAA